ncbi:hypothetical protein GO684_04755 [Wolbachia endosymbiont of Litomosoides brasiliensis]|nr:hypothetical protein [Wolbachia endosymbiont of Litomosoides brasiliensis]
MITLLRRALYAFAYHTRNHPILLPVIQTPFFSDISLPLSNPYPVISK